MKTFGDLQNSSVKPKLLGRNTQSILDLVISDGSISQDKMAEKIGVSKRAIEMQIVNLKAKGLLVREGADHGVIFLYVHCRFAEIFLLDYSLYCI